VVRQAGAVRRVVRLSGQYATVDGYLTGRGEPADDRPAVRAGSGRHEAADDGLLELSDLTEAASRTARTGSVALLDRPAW
jgi:hypothetical protein